MYRVKTAVSRDTYSHKVHVVLYRIRTEFVLYRTLAICFFAELLVVDQRCSRSHTRPVAQTLNAPVAKACNEKTSNILPQPHPSSCPDVERPGCQSLQRKKPRTFCHVLLCCCAMPTFEH